MPQSSPQPAPQPTAREGARHPPPADETASPEPGSATPDPSTPGALFRALVDAGARASLAYTADHQVRNVLESVIAAQLQPLAARLDRLNQEMDRRFDRVEAKLADHDRRLDVLDARVRLLVGAFGVLISVLLAVFGFLFTR